MPPKYRRRSRKPKVLSDKARKEVRAIATRAVKGWTPLHEIRFAAITSQFFTNGTIGQRVSANNLTSISLGDQLNQRTGPKIYITGIDLRVFCANQSATLERNFNIVLATDISRSEQLNLATFQNLMEDSAFVSQAPSPVNTNYQYWYNSDLFKVHFKRRLLLGEQGASDSTRSLFYNWRPKRPHKVQYERVNSTNIVAGKVWLIFHMAEAGQTASADVCDYQWAARVFYRSV